MLSVRPAIEAMTPYVPGEQPQDGAYIKLNTNENPYPCSPQVKAALGRVCQAGLERYPDPSASAFRSRAAEVLGLTPEQLLCGNGSDDILTIITRTFVDPGDLIRFPRPSYTLYDTLAAIQGARRQVINFNDDWSLPREFTEPDDRLRLVFLANPNSPSGTMFSPEEVARFAEKLNCPLVVDEAYADFAGSHCLELVKHCANVLVTRSMSKSYALAGLRFGFVAARPETILELAKVKDSYNCDALSIAGATAAIGDRDWFERTRTAIVATRERLTGALRDRGFDCVDSQANFVWCRHSQHDSAELYRRLKAAGVLIRYMHYEGWGDGIRISVGSDEQIDVLLERLADCGC